MVDYKRPESVLVVVCTRQGEVLLLRRREPPEFWQSVTGSLLWGESPEDAARRELVEETGVDPSGLRDACYHNRFPILPAWRPRYAPDVTENLEHVFWLCLPDRVAVRVHAHEHLEYRWVPWEQAAQWASSWTDRAAIERLVGGVAGTL